jgi:hypothetical protein
MSPKRERALRRYYEELEDVFDKSSLRASKPGQARTWFERYLARTLKTYGMLRVHHVGGRPLSRALGREPRAAFAKLLQRTSDRNATTICRWAAALENAYRSNVSPDDFSDWLHRDGVGGVSDRAAEVSKPRGATPKTGEVPSVSPLPPALLQAKIASPQ